MTGRSAKTNKTSTQTSTPSIKSCASNMADSPSPLTTERLVQELDKLRKTMTGEFTTLLNGSLEPIRSSPID